MHLLVPHFILESYAAGKMHGDFDAVGLFVDISGFSTITDALMTHGQHGAEVLAGVMRATFEPLIRSIYAQGGFVATQAGDAFTALFPIEAGNLAPERALAATWDIQHCPAVHCQHDTPYGKFAISAKGGLALGKVAWGILTSADGQRAAYYFQGTAVDGCAEAEHHARAGDIMLEAGLYARLQALIDVEPIGDHYRLTSLLASLPEVQSVVLPMLDVDLISRFFSREIVQQRQMGEFRQVVNVFISLPTVRTQSQLEIFMQTLFELQKRYGGLLSGLDSGDKGTHLLLFWGAPVTYENDVARALNFLLELQTQTAIPISGGVTYAIAHAGFIGSDLREEYTAFGRGVNLAARFMTTAPRGEIWLDEHVARHAQDNFVVEYIDAMSFKGFSQLQQVYTLYEHKEKSELHYEGRMIGRDAELRALAEFVQPIFRGGFAGALVIRGEPGMGKSRLVNEFLHDLQATSLQEVHVFLAQNDEIVREAFNPFRYWLKSYFGVSNTQVEARNKRSFNRRLDELIANLQDARLADELDRTRSFLGALVGLHWPDSLYEQLDAQARYENTFIGLATLLQAESLQLPVILFLEDAHWLDDVSKVFLPRLLHTLTAEAGLSYPIALLITARLEGAGLPLEGFPFRELNLEQLNQEALTSLAENRLGEQAGESLLALLSETADGNPFFAEQILTFLNEEQLLEHTQEGWKLIPQPTTPMPTDVSAVLVARLDRLTREVKEVVQAAAVLGREFEVNLLASMLQGDILLSDKLAQAEQAAIWFPLNEIRYLFKQALLRDAAYRMQLRARRQALHALAVEAIETVYRELLPEKYGELAYHAEQAGLVEKARAYLASAGQAAMAAYQNPLAVNYFSRALALTPVGDHSIRVNLLLERQAVFELLGEKDNRRQDLVSLEKLAEAIQDQKTRAKVKFLWADHAYDRGDYASAADFAQEAITLASEVDEWETVGSSYVCLSSALMRQGKTEAAVSKAERGLNLARLQRDPYNISQLFRTLGLLAVDQMDLKRARDYFSEGLRISQQSGDLRTQATHLNNLGMVAGYQGDYLGAQAYYEQALVLARQIGLRTGEGLVLGNLAWVAGKLGEFDAAREYALQNLRIARETGDVYTETYSLINLSAYLTASGEHESGLQSALQGQVLARKNGDRLAEAWSLTYLGHNLFAMRRLTEAADAYQEALEIRRTQGQSLLATEPLAGLAQVALNSGDITAAQNDITEVLVILEQDNTLQGTDEPLRVYLACYRVLDAIGDPRAKIVLETAYQLLISLANPIQNPTTRHSYLENISTHREIVAAWEHRQLSN